MARIIAPNMPHHIVQRGHNRRPIFVEDMDYLYYLDTLLEWKRELGIKVYAWCLMTNHVHLILNPGSDKDAIGQLMKRLAGRQTRYVNKHENRSGSLWEGRYKSSPIQSDEYLLQCCRYVDLNPVKAAMVEKPEDYPWSSYRSKVGLETSAILDFDPCVLALQNTASGYEQFVANGISQSEQAFIQQILNRNGLTGNPAFVDEIEQRLGTRVEYRGRGRPRKAKK